MNSQFFKIINKLESLEVWLNQFNFEKFSLPFLVIAVLIFTGFVVNLPYFSLVTSEEKLYAGMAIKNFIGHGASLTNWLPNYTTRVDGSPFVYTHLNDLPSQLSYLLSKISFRVEWMRFVYLSVTILSFLILFKIMYTKYGSLLAFASLGFLYSKWTLVFADHLHVPFSFLVSIIALAIALNRKENGNRYLVLSLLNILFAASFSWFAAVNLTVFTIGIALIDYRGCRRYITIVLLVGYLLTLCLAKIYLNSLYLGSDVASQEIIQTISNRITGVPNINEMFNLFNSKGIVLWGYQIQNKFYFYEYIGHLLERHSLKLAKLFFLILLLYLINSKSFKHYFFTYKSDILTIVVFLISLSSWNFLFPAHANGYSNPLLGGFYLFIVLALIFLIFHQVLVTSAIKFNWLIYFFCLSWMMITNLNLVHKNNSTSFEKLPVEMQNLLDGKSVFTNISVIFLGYSLPNSFIFGRCEPSAISNSDPTKCYNFFENISTDTRSKSALEHPQYFVFSENLVSGNTAWTSPYELKRYKEILQMKLGPPLKIFMADGVKFEVYEIL